MAVEILSVATAVPEHRLDQQAALAFAQELCCTDERQSRYAATLYRHSGVDGRYSVLPHTEAYRWAPTAEQHAAGEPNPGPTTEERMAYYEEHALPLAVKSSSEALRRARSEPAQITHVVTASCTGFTAPGIDSGLIERLGLRRTTERVHVGYMGCHGAINAMRVARGLASADPNARILLCATELCSLHYTFFWDMQRMLGNALFADGSGALIVAASPGAESLRDSNSGLGEAGPHEASARLWRLAATGSYLVPNTADAMTWSIGNHGFAMTISPKLPKLIRENVAGWLNAWLDCNGLTASDIRSWAIHSGGPKIVEAAEAALGLSSDHTQTSRDILARYGNMSSATVLFILDALQQAAAEPPCLMLGFGPGLIAEAALLL
jgi:predicted naringenin-chalcone synthase